MIERDREIRWDEGKSQQAKEEQSTAVPEERRDVDAKHFSVRDGAMLGSRIAFE